jgi:hypothetical protein
MDAEEKVSPDDHFVSKNGMFSPLTVLDITLGMVHVQEDINGRDFYLSPKELFHTYERD